MDAFEKLILGYLSHEGYKKDSPDKDRPYNIIPSGDITMKDVEFPVLGQDNLGNKKIMQPGKEYKFPGNYVIEVPLAQQGGQQLDTLFVSDPNDTRLLAYKDSLDLYKHFDYFAKYMEDLTNKNSGSTNRPLNYKNVKGQPGKLMSEKEKKEHLRRINSQDGFHFSKEANYISPSGAIYNKYGESNDYYDENGNYVPATIKPKTFKYPVYHKEIAPIRFTSMSLHGDLIPEYKKPTQPVKYKKPEEPIFNLPPVTVYKPEPPKPLIEKGERTIPDTQYANIKLVYDKNNKLIVCFIHWIL